MGVLKMIEENSNKLNNARKEMLFGELSILSNKKALLENKLIDLFHKELNLTNNPNKYDYYPANQTSNSLRQRFEDETGEERITSQERKIGNTIISIPKYDGIDLVQNKEILIKIKNTKLKILKQLNLITQKLNLIERQYSSLEQPEITRIF